MLRDGGKLIDEAESEQGFSLGRRQVERDFIVTNKLGMHARVAGMIVTLANRFECDLWFVKDGNKVNGRSVLDLLTLGCRKGSTIKAGADGKDAEEALAELAVLFQTKFGES